MNTTQQDALMAFGLFIIGMPLLLLLFTIFGELWDRLKKRKEDQ